MRNNAIHFNIHEKIGSCTQATAPRGYRKITINMIFDMKLDEGFTRKSGIVVDGHTVDTPPYMTYASGVSRDSVIIILLIADLNGLDLQCTDVQNAYIIAKTKKPVYFYAVEEFGKDWGKIVVLVIAVYGMKGSGSAWAV